MGFFLGVHPSSYIKFSDICSLHDAAANISVPHRSSASAIRASMQLSKTPLALFIFKHFLTSQFPTALEKNKTVPGGMTQTVEYLSFRGGQGNVYRHERLTRLCCSAPSGRLTILPAFTPSLAGTVKCEQFVLY